ncbi:BTB/POZ protein [Rhizophagus irregularis DAOM 181602=DAOM 197198]|nr:BTB/POZ protein [Rhizophagus irregularis DAOM 181602=DAOM 197198]
MSSKFWAELSSDYEKLFETETGYDVIIYAGEEQNIKEIHAHSNVLKPNISPQLFNIILRFIYCGNIELKNLQGSEVLKDDLNIDEIEIWEYLSKWCFTQQNIKDDPTNWNKDDIIRVEIPNVKPKTSLPTSRKQKLNFQIDSTLIESNHIPLFASWIDKKDSSHYRKNVPYDFKLLYRSSQDGVDTKSFHKNCDNKGATIWIAKIKDSTQLIGGKDISTSKVSYVKKQDRAVWNSYSYGPTMGNLYNCNNNWSNIERGHGDNYPNIGIPENFEVEDYEVFQVIEK